MFVLIWSCLFHVHLFVCSQPFGSVLRACFFLSTNWLALFWASEARGCVCVWGGGGGRMSV